MANENRSEAAEREKDKEYKRDPNAYAEKIKRERLAELRAGRRNKPETRPDIPPPPPAGSSLDEQLKYAAMRDQYRPPMGYMGRKKAQSEFTEAVSRVVSPGKYRRATGGPVRGVGCATKGYGKAMKK